MLDFHNHLIPGVDDGVRDADGVYEALTAMRQNGVTTLIATPHFDGSLTHMPDRFAARMEKIDKGWETLAAIAAEKFPGLTVLRGAEVKLDTPDPDLSDDRLRLGGTPYALVEFARFTVPPESHRAVANLVARGWKPIIAHPERYLGIREMIGITDRWLEHGALLQVNCGSLVGKYGSVARDAALLLLKRGVVSFLASDFHGRSDPAIEACRSYLRSINCDVQAELLLDVNPSRILENANPEPVPPIRPRLSAWERLKAVFR